MEKNPQPSTHIEEDNKLVNVGYLITCIEDAKKMKGLLYQEEKITKDDFKKPVLVTIDGKNIKEIVFGENRVDLVVEEPKA